MIIKKVKILNLRTSIHFFWINSLVAFQIIWLITCFYLNKTLMKFEMLLF